MTVAIGIRFELDNEQAREVFRTGIRKATEGKYEAIIALTFLDRTSGYLTFKYSSIYEFGDKEAGLSQRDVRDYLRFGRKLVEVPELAREFEEGRISYSKLRALTAVVTRENVGEWLETASNLSSTALEHFVAGARDPVIGRGMVPMMSVFRETMTLYQAVAEQFRRRAGRKIPDAECMHLILEFAKERLEQETPEVMAPRTSTKGRHVSADVKRRVRARARNCCERCGNIYAHEFHHIVPVSEGGDSTEANVLLLCWPCHHLVVHGREWNEPHEANPETASTPVPYADEPSVDTTENNPHGVPAAL